MTDLQFPLFTVPRPARPIPDRSARDRTDLASRAETAERRLAFLSEVSAVLGSSLDLETTLADLARLAVPSLCDWCIVYLADEPFTVRRVAISHSNPEDDLLAQELSRCMAPDHEGRYEPIEAVLNGKSVLMPVVTDEVLKAIARDDTHLAIIRRMRIRSSMCVPLMVQGKIAGALLFATADSGRVFGRDDLLLAEDLAARTALAMENARLYRTAQEARRRVEELNQELKQSVVETHHRVKNNLQIIAAMIDARLMDDHYPVGEMDLRRLASNVRALSTVHDTLTQQARADGSAFAVSTGDVLGRLIPLIEQTAPGYRITLGGAEAQLTNRQGTTLALAVNELVSNAVKYGRSAVDVVVMVDESECVITIADDGEGFPSSFSLQKDANTGLGLVDRLCKWDLNGDVDFANQPFGGALVTIRFPLAR